MSCPDKSRCLEHYDNRKLVSCEQRKKRYILENDKHFCVAKYHLDGGIFREEHTVNKCDYLYVVEDTGYPTAIMIELKGNDIKQAIKQIKDSVGLLSKDLPGHRIYGRIVCRGVPRLYNDPSVKNCKNELRKNFHGNLKIEENDFSEKYSSLDN